MRINLDQPCGTCSLEHPLDRLACCVIKQAILDALPHPGEAEDDGQHRQEALYWLKREGRLWMEALEMHPELILQRILESK